MRGKFEDAEEELGGEFVEYDARVCESVRECARGREGGRAEVEDFERGGRREVEVEKE
jgi:hypothetical protein